MRTRPLRASACSALAIALACGLAAGQQARAADEVTQERLLNPDKEPGNWLLHHQRLRRRTASRRSTRSTRDNVKDLKVAWTMQLGGVEGGGIWTHGGLEGTPIAEDGFLYVTDGWGSVYKIDAHGGQGKLVWKMDPKTDHDWAGAVACCGVDNRGVALWGDKVISHTLDGRLIATNKETGEVAWQRQVADPDKGEVITGAPLVVKDMAITGVAGAEYGIRGWIAATDLEDQQGGLAHLHHPGQGRARLRDLEGQLQRGGHRRRLDLGDRHLRPGEQHDVSGASATRARTGTTSIGPGDNLYTDSTLALDADTGKIKWHFQHTPNDPFDYDSVSENVLVDLPDGRPRSWRWRPTATASPMRWTATNGEFVWGTPFVKKVTWTKGLDPKTGKPRRV